MIDDRSPSTFQLAYSAKQASVLLDQTYNNTIGGFKPNALGSDPNFGKCLQCAALDRARYKLTPTLPRSDFCAKCFTRYCFDPAAPPDGSLVIGRRLGFVDPDPQGLSRVEDFFSRNRYAFIGGLIGFAVLLTGVIVWLYVSLLFSLFHSR